MEEKDKAQDQKTEPFEIDELDDKELEGAAGGQRLQDAEDLNASGCNGSGCNTGC